MLWVTLTTQKYINGPMKYTLECLNMVMRLIFSFICCCV